VDEIDKAEIEAASNLRAAQLRELTGLSDRQLHEWAKRGALPHDRARGGQRRVSAWEAMAVKILAAIRDRYQLPLTKLRPLLQWMMGNDLSDIDEVMAVMAPYALVPKTQAQADFAKDLRRLSQERSRGISILKQVPGLLARANRLRNPGAKSAVHRFAAGLFPIYRALCEMTTGFPVFLVSDLQDHSFVNEPLLIDLVRAGTLGNSFLAIRVDEHVNAVLKASGAGAIPLRHRACELEEIPGELLEEKERAVLDLLRQRDFERIMIEPKGNAYRIEITCEVADAKAEQVEKLVRRHDYQSILVKTRQGKIARLTQTVSILTPDSADGKIPHRAGTDRSHDE